MVKGRGSMGLRKHRISGVAPLNRRVLQQRTRELNKESEVNQPRRTKMFGSVSELMSKKKEK